MGNGLLKDLQDEIGAGNVVAVIGAGVSIGATNNRPVASWHGLLHHGVDRCRELKDLTGVDEKWARRVHEETDSGDLDDMLSAAEKISRKLGAPDGGEYRRWLRETIGELKAVRPDVLEALRDLRIALATTNYDGLVEEVTALPAVTWMDGAKVERVLRRDERGVLHLHGHWDRPESVILSIRSYENVLGDAHHQAMQRAMRSLKTLLFVGCGEGLVDPNFGALLEWSAKVFPGSEYRHFRLARESEVTELQRQHQREQRIFVLSYGESHADLAPFLRRLRAAHGSGHTTQTTLPASGQATLLPPAPLCFGRESEIEDLVSTVLATTPPPVPLLGPPGIGKTAITLVALNDPRVATRYGKRRFFVRCENATSREMLVAEIARNVGLEIGPPLEAALLSMLESEPVVLALDNAETPWEVDLLRVEELLAQLAAVPGLALIASLRGGSRPGAVRWRDAIEPQRLRLTEARKAFLAIAGEKFASDPHLDELLGVLGGVPLAITLLGYTAEGQPYLRGLLIRWNQERTEMLQRGDAKEKMTNIEISYKLSLDGRRMTTEGLRLLRVLSCLPDGVAQDDVEAVYPGCGYRAAGILRQTGLAFDDAGRLRVLAPLREYMGRKYPPQPYELEPVFAHYLDLAISHGGNVDEEGSVEAITRLTVEIGNLETMILRALDRREPEIAIQAAISLAEFVRLTGLGSVAPLERAAEIARNLDSQELFAHCLKGLGDIALARSDHKAAHQRYEKALSIYENVSNILGHANCIYGFGNIALACDNHKAARQHYEEAMPLYQHIGNILGQANCIKGLGDTALEISDHNAARQRYDKALPLYKSCGKIRGQANCIFRLGKIDLSSTDYHHARRRFEEALPLYQRVGDILGQANCVYSLGNIALELSDHDNARQRYKETLPLYQRVGQILGQANCIQGLANVALEVLDKNTARQLQGQCLATGMSFNEREKNLFAGHLFRDFLSSRA